MKKNNLLEAKQFDRYFLTRRSFANMLETSIERRNTLTIYLKHISF